MTTIKVNLHTLFFVIFIVFWVSISTQGCTTIDRFLALPTPQADLNQWAMVTDQETLSHLDEQKESIFALSEQGFVVIYPKDSVAKPYIDPEVLTSDALSAFWIESVSVERNLPFETQTEIQQETEGKHSSKVTKTIDNKLKEDEIEIEGAEIEIEAAEIEIDGAEIEIEEEQASNIDEQAQVLEIEIEDLNEIKDTNSSKLRNKIKKQRLTAAYKYVAYVGSPDGLYAKSYIFNKQWYLLNPQQRWVKIFTHATSHLTKRAKGGAWWGGPKGFGVVQHAQISPILGQENVKFLSEGKRGLYLVSLSDELFIYTEHNSKLSQDQINADSESALSASPLLSAKDLDQERLSDFCQGPILAMNARMEQDQVLLFCGGGAYSLVMKEGEVWHQFTQAMSVPRQAQIQSFAQGWIYQTRGLWYSLVTKKPSTVASANELQALSLSGQKAKEQAAKDLASKTKQQQTTSSTVLTLKSIDAKRQLWLSPLTRLNEPQALVSSRISAWTSSKSFNQPLDQSSQISQGDTLLIARPYQGIEQWHLGLDSLQKTYFKTKTLSGQVIQKAFITNKEGHLITTSPHSTLIGTGKRWTSITPNADVGTILGITQCKSDLVLLTSRKKLLDSATPSSTADKKTRRYLELWPNKAKKAQISLDWSSQDFREGEPSLGEIKCDLDGTIFANLFWGYQTWRVSVGLLIIEPHNQKMILWERKQGYDGEESLSETPLLPSSTFNAMQFAKDQSLFIATNSGLLRVQHRVGKKSEQLKVFDEAHGLSIESFSDLVFEPENENIEHLWLSSPYGLLRMFDEELRVKLKGTATALAYEPQQQNLWISFKQQLWVGQGQGESREWLKVKLPSSLGIGQINHIFPTKTGGLWLVSEQGVFYHQQVRNLLR